MVALAARDWDAALGPSLLLPSICKDKCIKFGEGVAGTDICTQGVKEWSLPWRGVMAEDWIFINVERPCPPYFTFPCWLSAVGFLSQSQTTNISPLALSLSTRRRFYAPSSPSISFLFAAHHPRPAHSSCPKWPLPHYPTTSPTPTPSRRTTLPSGATGALPTTPRRGKSGPRVRCCRPPLSYLSFAFSLPPSLQLEEALVGCSPTANPCFLSFPAQPSACRTRRAACRTLWRSS